MKTKRRKQHSPKLTTSERNQIVDMRADGMSAADIAKTLKFGTSTVHSVIRKHGKTRVIKPSKKSNNTSDEFRGAGQLVMSSFSEIMREFDRNRRLIAAMRELLAKFEEVGR